MNINIVKKQHPHKKTGYMILTLDIDVVLTAEEKQLLSIYRELTVDNINFPKRNRSDVKVDRITWPLSSFHLSAHAENSYISVGITEIMELEKAVIQALTQKVTDLRAMGNWNGSETILA
jgi:hypothetical protein